MCTLRSYSSVLLAKGVGSRLGGQNVGCAAAQLHEFHVSPRRSTLKAIDILCTVYFRTVYSNHTSLVGKSDGRITGISALHVSVILSSFL